MILNIKKKFDKKKKIKLQIIFGLTKAVPKLNLTLAPLNINSNNLLLEFNQYKNLFFEDKYIINTVLYFNILQPFLLINKIKFYFLFYLLNKNSQTNNFQNLFLNLFFSIFINKFIILNKKIENKNNDLNFDNFYYKFGNINNKKLLYFTLNDKSKNYCIYINESNILKKIKNYKHLFIK